MPDQSDLDADLKAEQLLYDIGLRHRGGGRPLSPHGTAAAYQRHLRWGEEPCEPCREANTQHKRDRRATGELPADSGRRKPIDHGSLKGYQQHRYRGETPCSDCRHASAAYQRDRKAALLAKES